MSNFYQLNIFGIEYFVDEKTNTTLKNYKQNGIKVSALRNPDETKIVFINRENKTPLFNCNILNKKDKLGRDSKYLYYDDTDWLKTKFSIPDNKVHLS